MQDISGLVVYLKDGLFFSSFLVEFYTIPFRFPTLLVLLLNEQGLTLSDDLQHLQLTNNALQRKTAPWAPSSITWGQAAASDRQNPWGGFQLEPKGSSEAHTIKSCLHCVNALPCGWCAFLDM